MNPIADMVEQMLARGVDHDLIVLAVRTAESGHSTGNPVDAAAENRRAYDRERKRKERMSTGNPPEIPPDTQSAIYINSSKKLEDKKIAKRQTGHRLSDDWKPTEAHYADGQRYNFSRGRVDELAADMRLWARANEHRAVARKSNWDLTFSAWIRRVYSQMPAREKTAIGAVDTIKQEGAWTWALEQEQKTGSWPSRQVKKSDIPREFIQRWEAQRAA